MVNLSNWPYKTKDFTFFLKRQRVALTTLSIGVLASNSKRFSHPRFVSPRVPPYFPASPVSIFCSFRRPRHYLNSCGFTRRQFGQLMVASLLCNVQFFSPTLLRNYVLEKKRISHISAQEYPQPEYPNCLLCAG